MTMALLRWRGVKFGLGLGQFLGEGRQFVEGSRPAVDGMEGVAPDKTSGSFGLSGGL